MARTYKSGYIRDHYGTSYREGTVNLYEGGTTTPAKMYAAASGGTAVYHVHTTRQGFYEYWIDPEDYSPAQTFKEVHASTGMVSQTYDYIALFGGGTGSSTMYAAWDPYIAFLMATTYTSVVALTNDLKTLTCLSAPSPFPMMSTLTIAKTSGKLYFEYTISYTCDAGTVVAIGVANGTTFAGVGIEIFAGNKGIGTNGVLSSTAAYGENFVSGDVLMCAFDIDNLDIWWGKNGTWFDGGDPVTGTSPAYDSGTLTAGVYYNIMSIPDAGPVVTVNYGSDAFAYAVPAGFVGGWYKI
jgi:hypothetical protein